MYLPSHFEQHDTEALHALMREHPLATLVSLQADGPTADHVPLEFDAATRTLRGHVARANPLWRVAGGQAVLAVFCGPQTYVTPSCPTSTLTARKSLICLDRGSKAQTTNRAVRVRQAWVLAVGGR